MLFILGVLFFFSGASALIYQVLWLRMLALVLGVTVYAASTVLASFMAGLAIGSAVAGRIADRVRRPLAWFGAAELLIAATAVVLTLCAGSDRLALRQPGSRPDGARPRRGANCLLRAGAAASHDTDGCHAAARAPVVAGSDAGHR